MTPRSPVVICGTYRVKNPLNRDGLENQYSEIENSKQKVPIKADSCCTWSLDVTLWSNKKRKPTPARITREADLARRESRLITESILIMSTGKLGGASLEFGISYMILINE